MLVCSLLLLSYSQNAKMKSTPLTKTKEMKNLARASVHVGKSIHQYEYVLTMDDICTILVDEGKCVKIRYFLENQSLKNENKNNEEKTNIEDSLQMIKKNDLKTLIGV